jgi:hypothetical protein
MYISYFFTSNTVIVMPRLLINIFMKNIISDAQKGRQFINEAPNRSVFSSTVLMALFLRRTW